MPLPPLPWYIVLLTSVPETFLILKMGFQFFNLHVSYTKALALSLIVSIFAIFVWKLPIPFGVHTIILLVFATILTTIVTGTKLLHCFIAILAGLLILLGVEGVVAQLALKTTGTTTNSLTLNPWLNVLYFLPAGTIMSLFYLAANKRNCVILDLSLDRD